MQIPGSKNSCVKNFVQVHEKASGQLSKLYYLYSGKPFEFGSRMYPSAFNAFASQHVADEFQFAEGQLFTSSEFVLGIMQEHRASAYPLSSWKQAKTVEGNLAKLVFYAKQTFRLDVVNDPSDDDYEDWAIETWKDIFEQRFKDPELLDVLLSTEGQIVFSNCEATEENTWTGRVLMGGVVGGNLLGKLLTEFRDAKRKKRKREEDDEDDDELVVKKSKTAAQIVADAFKAAHENGTMIDLASSDSEDEFLPDDWGQWSPEQKCQHAVDNNWGIQEFQQHVKPALDAVVVNPVMAPAGAVAVAAAPVEHPFIAPATPDGASSFVPFEAPASPAYMPQSPAYTPSSPAYAVPPLDDSSGSAASGLAASGSAASGSAASGSAASGSAASGSGASGSGASGSAGSEDSEGSDEPIDALSLRVLFSSCVEGDGSTLPVGTSVAGWTLDDLKCIRNHLNTASPIYRIASNSCAYGGHVMVVRGFLQQFNPMYPDLLKDELCALSNVDKVTRTFGSVKKSSRYRALIGNNFVKGNLHEPDKSKRHSSQVPFSCVPNLQSIRQKLTDLGAATGVHGLDNLLGEINYYGVGGEAQPRGMSPHIRKESNNVAIIALGRNRRMRFSAYDGIQPDGPVTEVVIRKGDLVLFDEEATGMTYSGLHIRQWESGGRQNSKFMAAVDKDVRRKLHKKVESMKAKNKAWQQTDETEKILLGARSKEVNVW
jgi:hypothetical protein